MERDLQILRRVIAKALAEEDVCPGCGGWKSQQATVCLGCREITRDEQERDAMLLEIRE